MEMISLPLWLVALLIGAFIPMILRGCGRALRGSFVLVHIVAFLRAVKREGTKDDFWHAIRQLNGTIVDLWNHGPNMVQERLTDKLLFDFANWKVIAPYLDDHAWLQELWRPIQNGEKQFRTMRDGSVITFHRHHVDIGQETLPILLVEFSASKKQMENDSGDFAVALGRFMEMMRTFDPTLCGVATICTDHIPHISTLHPTRIINGWYGVDLDYYDARKDIP